jgi:hypothetical protein
MAYYGTKKRNARRAAADQAPPPPPAPEPVVAQAQAPSEATINEVLDWVGIDRDRAQEALDAELQSERPRKTLVSALGSLLA